MIHRFLAILLLVALGACGRTERNKSASVGIDFQIPETAKEPSPEASASHIPIRDFDSMRQFLQSRNFKLLLARAATVDSSHFSLFLEAITPSAPFTMTFRATTAGELEKLAGALPGVIRDYAKAEKSSLDHPTTKRLP